MKKTFALILTAILMLSLGSVLAETTYLNFGTGGTTGTYYALGGDIASLWMNNIPDLDVTAQATKASKANIMSISNGEMEVAFAQNDTMFQAYQADPIVFEGKKIDGFVGIGALYPEAIQVVVDAESDIKAIEDLKGRSVSVGNPGSGTYINATQVLEAAGLTIDDIHPQMLNFGESATAFQDKQIEAFFITSGVPNASIIEVANKRPIRLLTLKEDQMKALQEKYPFYVPVTVQKDTYDGIAEEVTIPSTMAVLICSKELPEELVYQMTKVLFEKTADLSHAKKEAINAKDAVQGVPTPFHPGAAKYFAEIGLEVGK